VRSLPPAEQPRTVPVWRPSPLFVLARHPVLTPHDAYRAARQLETLPARVSALQDRQARAEAQLTAVLGSAEEISPMFEE
jgi:hypothetical protein